MYEIHVTNASMGVRFEIPVRQMEMAIKTWAENNLHAPKMGKANGRITTERGDGYYAHLEGARSFVFHKAFKETIMSIIKNVGIDYRIDYTFVEHEVDTYTPYSCDFDNYGFDMVVGDPSSRFFYQNQVVDVACSPGRMQTIYELQPGLGKTKSFQKVMVRKGVRTAMIIRPTYVDKWLFDTCVDPTGLRLDRSKVLICKGVQSVYDAYEAGESGELDKNDIRFIIFPTVTLQLFLKEYISTAHSNAIDIAKFYSTLGVGLIGMDEVHEHFYLVYMSAILMNPYPLVEMSATLVPGQNKAFIAQRYLERFPLENRLKLPYIKTVDVRAFYYTLADKKMAFWANKMSPYNHMVFESKLMREGYHVEYCNMWWDMIEKSFLANYEPGQKANILFATIDMCDYFTQFAKQKLAAHEKYHEFLVSKYNGGDSYDDFILAELGVSTPGKAATAIDKPGLVHFFVTTPIDDQQLNEQIAGRPRPVREKFGWDMNPKVWFGHCINIPKHGNYLNSRLRSLDGKVLSFKIAESPYVIGEDHANSPSTNRSRSPLCRLDVRKIPRRGPKGVSWRGRRR